MIDLLVLGAVGFVGVLVGFGVGGSVASNDSGGHKRRWVADDAVLCYECRALVPPEFIQENGEGFGYPECPVCSGNMLPPVGSVAEGKRRVYP